MTAEEISKAKKAKSTSKGSFTRKLNACEIFLKTDGLQASVARDKVDTLKNVYLEYESKAELYMDVLNEDGDAEREEVSTALQEASVSVMHLENAVAVLEKAEQIEAASQSSGDSAATNNSATGDQVVAALPDTSSQQKSAAQRVTAAREAEDGAEDLAASIRNEMHLNRHAPKFEFPILSGRPDEYKTFFAVFDPHMNKFCKGEEETMLTYLHQYSTGKARDIVTMYLGQPDGYRKARLRLKEEFGKPHIIEEAVISDVLRHRQIKEGDFAGLVDYARAVERCFLQLQGSPRIDNQDTIGQAALKLPASLHLKWVKFVDKILNVTVDESYDVFDFNDTGRGRYPTFKDFTSFVDRESKILNNSFGREYLNRADVNQKRMMQNNSNSVNNSNVKTPSSSQSSAISYGTALSQQNDKNNVNSPSSQRIDASSSHLQCPLCQMGHYLNFCPTFEKMPLHERMDFVRSKRLCRNCLNPAHLSFECKKRSFCRQCPGKHANCLHDPLYDAKTNTQATQLPGLSAPNAQADTCLQSASPTTRVNDEARSTLFTCKVLVEGNDKKLHEALALVDGCSNDHFCSQNFQSILGKPLLETGLIRSVNCAAGKNVPLTCDVIGDLLVKNTSKNNSITMQTVYVKDEIPISNECLFTAEDALKYPHLNDIKIPSYRDLCHRPYADILIVAKPVNPLIYSVGYFSERSARGQRMLTLDTLLPGS